MLVMLAHYEIKFPAIQTEVEIFISSWLHENWSLKHTNKSIWCKLEKVKFQEIYLNGKNIKHSFILIGNDWRIINVYNQYHSMFYFTTINGTIVYSEEIFLLNSTT